MLQKKAVQVLSNETDVWEQNNMTNEFHDVAAGAS